MTRLKLILATSLSLFILYSTASGQQKKATHFITADSSYFLQYPSLLFGTLCPGQTIEAPFTIQNISMQQITIVELRALAPFNVVTPIPPVTLDPNQLQQIRVSFAPTGKGSFSSPFIIRLAGKTSGDTLVLHGDARDNSILVSKSNLDFGDLPVNRIADQTFTITNSGSDTLRISSISVLPNGSPFTIISPTFPLNLLKGETITVTIRFHPTLPGVVTPNANIHIDIPCPDTKIVGLRGRGIRGDIAFSVSSISYPDTWCTTDTRIDSIKVSNTGSDTVTVFNAIISGMNKDDYAIIAAPVLPATLKPNESIVFIIEFQPRGLGNRTAVLTITSADVNTPSKDIALTGILKKAVFLSLPNTLSFGDVRVGTMSDLTASIKNPNPVLARIQSIQFIPPDPTLILMTTLPRSIGPQDSTTITVRYIPSTDKLFTATMIVYFDLPCPDSIQVPLNGRGVQGDARINWSGLPPTLKCNTSTGDVTIENAGTADFNIQSFFFEGRDPFLYSLVNPPSLPYTLSPGSRVTVTVRFQPTTPPNGSKIGILGMIISGAKVDTLRVSLAGERISPIIQNTNIDFGFVDLRVSSTQTFDLQNIDPTPATLTFIDIQPPTYQFTGATIFALQPSSPSITLPVQFSPTIEQVYPGTVRFISQPCGDTIVVTLTGIGRRCRVTTEFALQNSAQTSDTIRAMMGDKITIPLVATKSFGNDNISSMTFTLYYNKTLLVPIGIDRGSLTQTQNVQYKIVSPGVIQVDITSTSTIPGGIGTLALMHFTTALGDQLEGTIVLILNSFQQKCYTDTSANNAYFILQSPCEDRRGESFKMVQRNTMQQNRPNPFSAGSFGNPSTTIEYSLVRDSFVDLSIYNLFGEKIETLVHEHQSVKRYQVEFNGMKHPTGIYYYVLQTDDARLTRQMVYMK